MTFRAVLLGFLGVAFICGFGYFNDAVLWQTYLVGNHMPASIYGILILFVLLINPLIRRFSKKLPLSRKEIAVILTLTLAVCCIPESGLMRIFPNSLVFPHKYNQTEPGWKEQGVVEMTPNKMLVDISKNEDHVLNGFIQGMGTAEKHISFSDIPWYGWKRTLLFWIPILIALWIALIGLSLVLHKQWSDHEHLPYPIASFVDSLLPEQGKARSGIFSKKLFWLGAGLVFVIHMNNYAYQWFPRYIVQIPTVFNFTSFIGITQTLIKGGGWFIYNPRIYFAAVGIAYFLSAEVSLSMGIGPIVYSLACGVLAGYGISVSGSVGGTKLSMRTFLLDIYRASLLLFCISQSIFPPVILREQ